MRTAVEAVRSTVADSATSVAIAAARNASLGNLREGLIIHNNSSEILYIAYGGTAATTAAGGYSYNIPADAHWEMIEPIFQGAIWGIWANNSTGAASITELY